MIAAAGSLDVTGEISSNGSAAIPDLVAVCHDAWVAAAPEEIWERIGDFCAVIRILGADCSYASGSGDVGSVRSIRGGAVLEPMVARTDRSYTYVQTKGPYADYCYHGTIAVEPAVGGTRLVYTIVFDPATMPLDTLKSLIAQVDSRAAAVVEMLRKAVEAAPRGSNDTSP